MRLTSTLTALLVAFFPVSAVSASTVVPAGPVAGTWEAGASPYIVKGGISIPDGNSLTIEPGVVVRFETGGLSVAGDLIAIADVNHPIVFTSAKDQPAAGDWSGISANWGSSCSLTHCLIEFASTGVTCWESHPAIANCIIQNNKEGISVDATAWGCEGGYASPTITSCVVSDNLSNGVSFSGSGSSFMGCTFPKTGSVGGTLSDCEIIRNGCGVYLSAWDGYFANGSSHPTIVKNRIATNLSDGIRIAGDDPTAATIEDNDIVENLGSGISCTSTSSGPAIQYNFIARNGARGIHNHNTSAKIEYNHILENDANGVLTDALTSFQHNGIFNNLPFQCVYVGTKDQPAPDNDWGTSNPEEIDAMIYDHLDDPAVGTLQYSPSDRVENSQPEVASTLPADGSSGAPLNVVIRVTFSEDMRASTLNKDTVILSDGKNIVSGNTTYKDRVLEFTPSKKLTGGTTYTLALSSEIQEATYLKNRIDAYSMSFVTTGN